MEFTDFCSHYLNMSQKEVFDDVRQSMADLMSGNSKGNSFGAKMVAKARERLAKLGPINTANGKNGGRPPVRIPLPKDKQEVLNFAADHGLDIIDAGNWYEANIVERKGHDKYGKPIDNWKGAVTNNDKTMKEKRRQLKNAC